MTKSRRASKSTAPTRPFRSGRIAIVGRPNVGKSTLLNALVGARVSITSRKPQTTRVGIAGILTTDDAQYVFVDTPGFQTVHRSALNARMNRSVRDAIGDVEVVVFVVDGTKLTPADRDVAALLSSAPKRAASIAAINKVDRIGDKAALLPFLGELAKLAPFAALVPLSAQKGWQLDALLAEIRERLPEGAALYQADDITDRDERFLAAEFVREQIFRQLGEEVPYSTTVTIDSFKEEGELRRIHATVYVDRANQRAILLGKDGERMRSIATQARREMERLFGGRVYLEVWVRVKSGWADDERMLARLGY